MILRLLPATLIGVLVGGLAGTFFTAGDPLYTVVWACAIPALILSTLVVASIGPGRTRPPGLALARVETVQRAGAESAGMQDLDLRLVVSPPRGTAYATSARVRVATESLRDYNAGSVLVVSRRDARTPDVTVVPEPDAEWSGRAEQARRDPSLIPTASSVPPWETATTTSPGTRRPGGPRPGLLRAAAILATVAAAALVLVPAYPSMGRAFTNLLTWNLDGGNMVTGDYQQAAVDELAAVAGGYEFTEINFYADYVLAEGRTFPGAGTVDDYEWRYGRATRDGPALIQPTDLALEVFDASSLDFSLVGEVARDALARARIQDVSSVYVFVSRDPVIDGGGPPVLEVYISGAYESVGMVYDFDGRLVRAD